MTRDNFGVLGRLFKFSKKKDDSFIERIVELFKADWFYGCVDRAYSQKQLEALQANKKDGYQYFIVRFANNKQLCVTYFTKTWENRPIDCGYALKEGYVKHVTYVTQTKVMKHETVPTLQKTYQPPNSVTTFTGKKK